jgi:hypothetical protein
MAYYDTNGDGSINLGDNIDPAHLEEINNYCDFNGDQNLDACEVHKCIVMIENEWRAENCPEYGQAFCECPFDVVECEGAWNCNDVEAISIEVVAYYDSNDDQAINPEDDIEADHYGMMVEYCDFNNDGTIDACEVHACVIIVENEWRAENCPENYGDLYCACPFDVVECPGAWNCDDIAMITEEVMMYYDSNDDGQINLGDDIESDHLEILVEYCDQDDNATLDACEIFECVVKCENEWRAENCPEAENVYCATPYECATCPGAWDCEDIYNISVEVIAYYDTNNDGQINLGDDIE